MITRRTYTKILKLTIYLIIAYFSYNIIYYYISYSKLQVIKESHKFKISSLINISENRLTYEAEYYLKDHFLGISCLLDSTYYLSITKVGQLSTNKSMQDIIYFSSIPFLDRNSLFNRNDIIAKTVVSTNETSAIFYNVSILPINQLSKVNVYLKNKILSKNIISKDIIEYIFNSSNINFSFNDFNKNDFGYVGFDGKSSLIFLRDISNNLYIISLSPIIKLEEDGSYRFKSPYKSLKEILQE